MISTTELSKDLILKIDGQLWMVIDFQFVNPGKGPAFLRTKMKGLQNGKFVERTYKSGEMFEEAEVEKIKIKFIYANRGKFIFCKESDPSARFELGDDIMGNAGKFLKPNELAQGLLYEDKIISIIPPIKVQLRVKESPPGIKGDRAQGGTKTVVLETGAEIQAPLFVEPDDILEINTETGEYSRRVDK